MSSPNSIGASSKAKATSVAQETPNGSIPYRLLRLEKEVSDLRQTLTSFQDDMRQMFTSIQNHYLCTRDEEDGIGAEPRDTSSPSPTRQDPSAVTTSDGKPAAKPSSLASVKGKRKNSTNIAAISSPKKQKQDVPVAESQKGNDSSSVPAFVRQHRAVFMEQAFGPGKTRASNELCKPQAELDRIVSVLENWEPHVNLKSVEDVQRQKQIRTFRQANPNGYKWSKTYTLEYIRLPDGTKKTIIRRIEGNMVGRIVVSREQVFGAIDEWHRNNGHWGQERTHNYCRQKYFNCTQALVRIYCETCIVCKQNNPFFASSKGSR
jgi:hypothetical protein